MYVRFLNFYYVLLSTQKVTIFYILAYYSSFVIFCYVNFSVYGEENQSSYESRMKGVDVVLVTHEAIISHLVCSL